jgi:hypothetical protein
VAGTLVSLAGSKSGCAVTFVEGEQTGRVLLEAGAVSVIEVTLSN